MNENSQMKLVNQYRAMAQKLAWQFWRTLPVSTKMWIDHEDLVSEAYLYILSRARETYDATRASRSTFLWTGISNLFLNFALSQQTKKRFGFNVPAEDLDRMGVGKRDKTIERTEAIDALLLTYHEASEDCRRGMRQWFGVEKSKVRRSASAKRNYQEFAQLAAKNRLTPNDCRNLMRGGMCLD